MLQLTIDLGTGLTVGGSGSAVAESMKVWSKVVRHEDEGVGFEFIIGKAADRQKMANLVDAATEMVDRNNA